jgi:uncharacterized protein (DUF1330 family)
MAKGYWIALVNVSDVESYKAYVAGIQDVFHKFSGRYVIRGGRGEPMEGKLRSRVVTVEFADYATALACYKSAEYAEVKKLRQHCATVDLVVVEGYDGAQL